MTPDLIILNGRLMTFDAARPGAEALAVRDGRIVAVGSTAEIRAQAGNATRVIDAAGGSVLPGFIDSHVHLFSGAAELDFLDIHGIEDAAELARAVRRYADARPADPMIMCVAAGYHFLGAGREPGRQDLDAILPDRPFAVMAADHHTVWANTVALDRAGILHGRDLPPGHEIVMGRDGLATGMLKESDAFGPVLRLTRYGGRELLGMITGADPMPPATPAERTIDKDLLARGLDYCARNGLTTLHNMDGNFYQLELLQELHDEGRLPCRVQIPFHLKNYDPIERIDEAVEMRRRFASDWVWSGRVKIFMDGVIDSHTALFIEDYPSDPGNRGEALFTPEQFNAACIRADAEGLQISVHAIGDLAVRRTLDGFEAARSANGARDSRHRIEHIEVIDPDDVARFRQLGVVASMQPLHAPVGGFFDGDGYDRILRPRHHGHCFAWRRLRDGGAPMVFSTDWPVVPLSVMRTVKAAVAPLDLGPLFTDERQTLEETLASYTRDNAWVEFAEDRKGRLAEGFLADITVLDRDIAAQPPDALDRVGLAATICGGRVTAT